MPEESRKHPAEREIPLANVEVPPVTVKSPATLKSVEVPFAMSTLPKVEDALLKYWRVDDASAMIPMVVVGVRNPETTFQSVKEEPRSPRDEVAVKA